MAVETALTWPGIILQKRDYFVASGPSNCSDAACPAVGSDRISLTESDRPSVVVSPVESEGDSGLAAGVR